MAPASSSRAALRAASCRARTNRNSEFILVNPVNDAESGGLGRLRFRRLDAGHAAAAVDAERHVPIDGGAADDAMLIAIVVDRVMLGRAIVPDRDVAGLPGPAHGVFGRGDVRLEQLEQLLAV